MELNTTEATPEELFELKKEYQIHGQKIVQG
jgi:hypothetical protein